MLVCKTCGGASKCQTCDGKGRPTGFHRGKCQDCAGTGKCKDCRGTGYVQGE